MKHMNKKDQQEDIFQNQIIQIFKDHLEENMFNQLNILNQNNILVPIHTMYQVIYLEVQKVYHK